MVGWGDLKVFVCDKGFDKESQIPRGQGPWVGVENPGETKGIGSLNEGIGGLNGLRILGGSWKS
jgi:hypothetical protein